MNSEEKKQRLSVEGKVIISSGVRQFEKGIAHISLIDTTYQDAAGVRLAETTISAVRHRTGGETIIDFRLEIPESNRVNPKNDYSVQVWIDTDGEGGGQPKAGDLFTSRTYPVLTQGFGNNLAIELGED